MSEIKFWTPKGQYDFLSNFYPAIIVYGDTICPSVEHFFQSQKFAGTEYEKWIASQSTAAEAARQGKRRDFPLRKDWEQVKEEIMLIGLRKKFKNVVLRSMLLNTGDSTLIENSPYDYYWGIGAKGTGKNRLGILLMQVREEIKNENV